MKVCITQGGVSVNGKLQKDVDLSSLSPDIHAANLDTAANRGVIEFKEGVTRNVQVRDFAAEDEAYRFALKNNKPLDKLQPQYKALAVQREPQEISDLGQFKEILRQLQDA